MTRRAAALLMALAIGCARTSPVQPGILTIAIPTGANSLDPRLASDDTSVRLARLIYTPLLQYDDRLRVAPALASSWDMPDQQTYLVHLRHGVRFHDGRELTSADVVYTFASFLDPAMPSPYSGAFRDVLAGVSADDRYTVRFTLKHQFGSFPALLVLPVVPAGAGVSLQRQPIGTGPYRLVSAVSDDRYELAAFDGCFEGRPGNDGLVLRVVPDDIMRGLELQKGSVDLVVNDLAPDIVHQLQRDARVRVTESPGADYQYVGFNLRDAHLRDERVRHAIGYAIDRDAIVRYLRRGLATPAVGVLPPMSWAFVPDVFTFTFDPDRARALLDAAGYPDPDGAGPRMRFTLSMKVSSNEFNRLQSAVIQQNLRDVGIDLDVRTYEFATLYADVIKGNFQVFTLQWVGVVDPDMLRRIFHSSQTPPVGYNRGFFRNPEVDRLIDEATRSTDESERRSLYGDAQRIIAREAPYISLWYKRNVAVASPGLRHVAMNPIADFGFLRRVCRVPCP